MQLRTILTGAVLAALLVPYPVPQPAAAGGHSGPPLADQFGVYNWNVDLGDYHPRRDGDILNWGADLVADTGTRTIRIYLGVVDIYQLGVGITDPLTIVANHPAYAELFRDRRFDTYLLTTYSAGSNASVWHDGFSAEEAATERAEIAALGRHLLRTYPTKKFVVLNWEGDNGIAFTPGGGADDATWTGFRDWIEARAAGVRDARAGYHHGRSRLQSGLEFNRVTTCQRCVVREVAPHVSVDLYSFSSWESVAAGPGDASAGRLTSALDTTLALVRAQRPDIRREHIIVGEFGIAREIPDAGECYAADVFRRVAAAARSWGVRYAIFWQIVDNVSNPAAVWNNFGLVKHDGTRSLSYRELTGLIRGRLPHAPDPASCPRIEAGGIVRASDGSTQISAGDTIAISGSGFAGRRDVVQVQANGQRYVIGAGSPGWSDTRTRITATLPADISGVIAVYVSHANGLDSNGQAVTLS
jgi:hypothetical protein